ncbi:MAG: MerR family transcriptional regulator [Firmicutes bacterium]|nr:MerR family transcriptional regulator [Bacillota bacterium]
MEYTVQALAKLAGVSRRTLRYYDEIGLLKPMRVNSSGYRIYGRAEVDLLQQILFYRELGMELKEIKDIVTSPGFDAAKALKEHREKLLAKRLQLDLLIENVNRTINMKEGRLVMTDQEKFQGFKKKMIADNEEKYGKETRERYGDQAVERANRQLMNTTQEDYQKLENLSVEVLTTLKAAMETGDPSGDLAQKAADLHRQWLCFYWDHYDKEAHANLAQTYVDDERFTEYYDGQVQPGAAKFLRDAVWVYTGRKEN